MVNFCIRNAKSGFTLIELLVVMVMIGIMSAAVINFNFPTALAVDAVAGKLVADIRYAQTLGMSGVSGISVSSPGGGNDYTVGTETKDVGGATLSSFSITFESDGTPNPNSQQDILLTSGSVTVTVRVYPETGFVEAL
ncbi:MAG: prepilin-type N-terminal cleavage/methylation domain-containing protein [Magnetococcales bacterium]|nr:prepilin-type N-terminal cleavage/methylation domain-containing protein [Magnetococcales bacterium]